jgi:hypothetical protein
VRSGSIAVIFRKSRDIAAGQPRFSQGMEPD